MKGMTKKRHSKRKGKEYTPKDAELKEYEEKYLSKEDFMRREE